MAARGIRSTDLCRYGLESCWRLHCGRRTADSAPKPHTNTDDHAYANRNTDAHALAHGNAYPDAHTAPYPGSNIYAHRDGYTNPNPNLYTHSNEHTSATPYRRPHPLTPFLTDLLITLNKSVRHFSGNFGSQAGIIAQKPKVR